MTANVLVEFHKDWRAARRFKVTHFQRSFTPDGFPLSFKVGPEWRVDEILADDMAGALRAFRYHHFSRTEIAFIEDAGPNPRASR